MESDICFDLLSRCFLLLGISTGLYLFGEMFLILICIPIGFYLYLYLFEFLDKHWLHLGSGGLACIPLMFVLGPYLGVCLALLLSKCYQKAFF